MPENIAITAAKNIGSNVKASVQDWTTSTLDTDPPTIPVVGQEHAMQTAASHNDMPTIQSMLGMTRYKPAVGRADKHESNISNQ